MHIICVCECTPHASICMCTCVCMNVSNMVYLRHPPIQTHTRRSREIRFVHAHLHWSQSCSEEGGNGRKRRKDVKERKDEMRVNGGGMDVLIHTLQIV